MGNGKFDPRKISDEQLYDIIKSEAKELNIAPYPIPDVLAKVREHYGDWGKYLDFRWKSQYDNYVQACISWALDEVKAENPIENKLYYELERYATHTGVSETEKKRMEGIVSMLSTQGIFPKDETSFYTLHEVIQWLDPVQQQALVDAVLHLKDYCDAEGVRSVLESADVNGVKKFFRVLIQNPNDTKHSANSIKLMIAAFVTRLDLMTRYVKRVATKTYKVKFDEPKLKAAIKQALDVATIIAIYVDLEGEIYLNRTKVGEIVSAENDEAADKEKIIDVMKESFLKVVDGYSKKFTAK